MVRRNVRDDGHIRRAVHAVQLEAAELEHGKVLRPDVRDAVKERRADVAAEVHGVPLRAQELGRDGRGRGLAVAAGDGEDAARAEVAERLHLGGEDRAVLRSLAQLRHDGQHARRAEDDIEVQMLEIVRAEGMNFAPCAAASSPAAPSWARSRRSHTVTSQPLRSSTRTSG